MAWFNRKTFALTEEEIVWITENSKTEYTSPGGSALYFTDMVFLMSKQYANTIEIRNLPPETDELTLRRMLSSKLSQNMDEAFVAGNL